jgi:hypothetical protein
LSKPTQDKGKITFKKHNEANKIRGGEKVRMTRAKHIIDILHMTREPKNLMKFKKLDKQRYYEVETGEIFEYQIKENRGKNIAGLKKTFKDIRNLINNNFEGLANELFITLTYKENMTDTRKLYKDFESFWRKLKRRHGDIDYLCVVEPQGRGAWHCHVLIRFNNLKSVFLKNDDEIAPLWGHGFTTTRSLKGVDNLGAYLNAYLTDVEVTDENADVIMNAIIDGQTNFVEQEDGSYINVNRERSNELSVVEKEVIENGKKVKKSYVKGARLHLYPAGFRIWRSSDGIKKPETVKMTYAEAQKIVGSRKANYSRTIELEREGQSINKITYEQYNMKRENGQE